MFKSKKIRNFVGHRAARAAVAITLTASLASYGCTTNRTPGAGEPTRSGPGVRTAPTAGQSTGSEGAQLPPPMTSSYRLSSPLRGANPRAIHDMSIDNGAIALPGNPVAGVRVLGLVNPGANAGVAGDLVTGQYVNPTQFTNPQPTVNASISSNPTSVISSGAGGGGTAGGIVSGVTSGGVTIDGSLVAPGNADAAALFTSVPPTLTMTSSGAPLTPGLASANVNAIGLTPTVTSNNAALAARAGASTLRTPTATTGPPGVIVQSGSASGVVVNPVRLATDNRGRVVVTNSSNQ